MFKALFTCDELKIRVDVHVHDPRIDELADLIRKLFHQGVTMQADVKALTDKVAELATNWATVAPALQVVADNAPKIGDAVNALEDIIANGSLSTDDKTALQAALSTLSGVNDAITPAVGTLTTAGSQITDALVDAADGSDRGGPGQPPPPDGGGPT